MSLAFTCLNLQKETITLFTPPPSRVITIGWISLKFLTFINVNRCCIDNNAFIEFHLTFFLVKDQLSKKVLMQGHLEKVFYKLSNSLSHYNSFEGQASSNVSPPTNVFLCENKSFKL